MSLACSEREEQMFHTQGKWRCRMTFSALRALYDKGRTEEVLQELAKIDLASGQHPEHDDLVTLWGWCYYHRKDFDAAYAFAQAVGSHQWGRELLACIHAYVPKFTNDEALQQIAAELGGENARIANAFVIRARAKDCTLLTHEEVAQTVAQHENKAEITVAHLFHNAARFFLEKSRGEDDLRQAVAHLDRALVLYPTDSGLHHRAAATFWKSQAVERLEGKAAAVPLMQACVELWQQQVNLDPTNAGFQKNLTSAGERLAALQ